MDNGGSNPENQTLAPIRIQAFVQEPARDGNALVALPYQTTDAENSRLEHKKKMKEELRIFERRFKQ